MPNFASALNDQIRRLSRREITSETKTTRRLTAQYRRDIAALKREVASLRKSVAFLETQEKRRVVERPAPPEVDSIRFRADGLRSYRAKLGLSAKDFGRLVGVAGLTVYQWESKKSRPRKAQLAKLAAVRGLGKREAIKRLELLGGSNGATTGRGRGTRTGPSAQEFVLSLVGSRKATTSAQINEAWKKAGRQGKADNTLSLMVKARKLKRAKLKDERGSRYSTAA
jgi:transcriptional regulator with XRE-family HTH domain